MKKRVLVVDDEAGMRALLEDAIDSAGGEVVTARDGLEAWTRLDRGEKFDYVVSDQDMPEMKGDELLRKMKEDPRTSAIPFILTSGRDDATLEEACTKLGAVFLAKPYSIFKLLALLGMGLEIEA